MGFDVFTPERWKMIRRGVTPPESQQRWHRSSVGNVLLDHVGSIQYFSAKPQVGKLWHEHLASFYPHPLHGWDSCHAPGWPCPLLRFDFEFLGDADPDSAFRLVYPEVGCPCRRKVTSQDVSDV